MKANLSEKRYKHSLGVQDMAVKLAKIYGVDVDKADFAGRYHDIAKCFDEETMNSYVRKYGLPDKYLGNPALAHSKVAAEILKHEFGVVDEDVLNSVRYHTTGRRDMSLLEEIVFAADAIEDNRDYPSLKELQKRAETDLHSVSLEILDFIMDTLSEKGRLIDPDTIEAREWIKEITGEH